MVAQTEYVDGSTSIGIRWPDETDDAALSGGGIVWSPSDSDDTTGPANAFRVSNGWQGINDRGLVVANVPEEAQKGDLVLLTDGDLLHPAIVCSPPFESVARTGRLVDREVVLAERIYINGKAVSLIPEDAETETMLVGGTEEMRFWSVPMKSGSPIYLCSNGHEQPMAIVEEGRCMYGCPSA